MARLISGSPISKSRNYAGSEGASTYDKSIGALHTSWVSDHEIGNLAGLPILLAMDVWEHAYLLDYSPSERKITSKLFQ